MAHASFKVLGWKDLSTLFGRAWPSYALILLLQTKVLWRIWDLKDLTIGDTSSYFRYARLWADGFHDVVVWSPLYTAFYGSFLFVTSNILAVTIMHRLVIVMMLA